jgi:iron(III) transport system substrate-binding protein
VFCAGCGSREPFVVVYTALDREFSEPILGRFTAETGIRALPVYDVESTKTVGLVQKIMAEHNRPQCDVFWNNEIVNTLRLKEAGLLDVYRPPAAEAFPDAFKSTDGTWHGFAARARILIVNTDLVGRDDYPSSIFDLTDAKWKGRVGIAKPIAGTTATHAACLFAVLGEEKAKQFFRDLKANGVRILSGNKQVAESVAAGELAVGLTDTDDAMGEVRDGRPVTIAYLDAADDQIGTLFIPNTLAIVKGCPHPEQARALVDYLLSPPVEAALAKGPSAQIPLNPAVEVPAQVIAPDQIHAMQVDFEQAAARWDSVQQFIVQEFLAP